MAQERARLIRAMDARMAGLDALILPTTPIVAPKLAEVATPETFGPKNMLLLRNTSMVNFFDLCAISLPLPRGQGLSAGLMVVARNGQDHHLFRIAAAVERLFASRTSAAAWRPAMGPFPHDAPPATISDANPDGHRRDGVRRIRPSRAARSSRRCSPPWGSPQVARHRSKDVTLWRQGLVNFVVNAEPDSFAQRFAAQHGPCACAMAFRVVDAKHAYERALSLGAEPGEIKVGPMELAIPAIKGIGGSLLYFVDRYGENGSIWDVDFRWTGERDPQPAGVGLHYIDHLTHNVQRGRMDHWAGFYEKLFNFRQIRFFNIEGKLTGLISRAMTSPCGKIRIPINESLDDKSQIEEYLKEYHGEGIQHVAMGARDIYESVAKLRANGLAFMPPPPATYYEKVDARLPGHGEPVEQAARSPAS